MLGTYYFKYEGFGDGQGYKANNVTVQRECTIGFKMDLGASIRAANDNTSGIRFTGRLSAEGYEWLTGKGATFTFAITANGVTKTQDVAAADDAFLARAALQMSDYLISDCSGNKLESLLNRLSTYELDTILDIEGENRTLRNTLKISTLAEHIELKAVKLLICHYSSPPLAYLHAA